MLSLINRPLQNTNLIRSLYNSSAIVIRNYSQNIENNEEVIVKSSQEKGGFAKAFEKFSMPDQIEKLKEPDLPFATLFKNSKFVELGDPVNKVVVGKIFHIVDDDLYIDFGWKFHCVCTRPIKNSSAYVRGARVKLRIKDLEISSRFLGSAKDLTLMEADGQLLGVLSSPATPRSKQ
ncbi:hypothetical protein ACKWTF_002545 [Chironomus riparius]